MKKIFIYLIAALCLVACEESKGNYVDLGLPSGTLWKKSNQSGFYTQERAIGKYGDHVPTEEQFLELRNFCNWENVRENGRFKGTMITGANGNTLFLPADGARYSFHVDGKGLEGRYMTSSRSPYDPNKFYYFYMGSSMKHIDSYKDGQAELLLRLVMNPE